MALNPTGNAATNNWNYNKPANDDYSLELVGTVVAIQEVQAMNFGAGGKPTTPKFWDSGQPVWNIRFVFAGPSGGYKTWTFTPAGKAAREGKKPSVHIDLFKLAGGKDLRDLIGKTIKVTTEAPPAGFNYGIGNPRPWKVELVEGTVYTLSEPLDEIFLVEKLLANSGASGGVMNQAQPAMNQAQPSMNQAQPSMNQAQPAWQQDRTAPDPLTEDIPFF